LIRSGHITPCRNRSLNRKHVNARHEEEGVQEIFKSVNVSNCQ
jgi:hypothetical protein